MFENLQINCRVCEKCLVNRKGFKNAVRIIKDSVLYVEWMVIHTNNKKYCYTCQKTDCPCKLEHLIINSEEDCYGET